MSGPGKNTVDEAAFIDAIQSNPEDEASRLVYADWLEERGDPRAEYLRLEAQYCRIRPRLEHLSTTLDKEWLGAVSRTYALVFMSLGPQKIMAIKVVREVSGLGLKDAKDLVEMAGPVMIRDGYDIVEAERVRKQFDGLAVVVVMPSHQTLHITRPFNVAPVPSRFGPQPSQP